MRILPNFVRFSARKVPLAVNGGQASTIDPTTWATYDEAKASTRGVGVGFVLNGDGIGVIDLDHCIEGGVIATWAQDVLDANPGTFTEVSISGTGLHVWGLLPASGGRVIRDGRSIEIYSQGRYIALGAPLKGTVATLKPLQVSL
ncbi:primase-polymerase (primpol)-like protein [Mycetocola sp. CAN_C7]|uniref:hypothetical protein n=1 Tax=Mycetocola sp. CAN_C7 TaxID=2787724 RepID=UPI0018C9EC25